MYLWFNDFLSYLSSSRGIWMNELDVYCDLLLLSEINYWAYVSWALFTSWPVLLKEKTSISRMFGMLSMEIEGMKGITMWKMDFYLRVFKFSPIMIMV